MGLSKKLKRHPIPRLIILLVILGGSLYLFGRAINVKQETLARVLTGSLGIAPFAYFFFADRLKQWLSSLLYLIKPAQVAEIELRGPIQEDVNQGAFGGQNIPAKHVVKRIKKCARKDYDALIINIDSPGGAPVPSDDIRRALMKLDIPTYTYINSLCASGGYMIACGTDFIHARQDSLVGSIGVIANMNKFGGLADKLGIDYERFVGGEHKDTHRPLKELDDDERDYWQGVIDASYENFVDVVADSRNLDPAYVKATKAEVLLGTAALKQGLVDNVGSRAAFRQYVEDREGIDDMKIRRYDGGKKVFGTVEHLFSAVAYAFGRGIGSAVSNTSTNRIEYRM
ncbi:S49 family peptidase [Halomontanus rarus]|uniref:S49 family peptidase n=1 Tax=Halomontanus rarus TaxID=3034020 RepID=UPI001A99D77B